jgi:hypothetical protein
LTSLLLFSCGSGNSVAPFAAGVLETFGSEPEGNVAGEVILKRADLQLTSRCTISWNSASLLL